MMAGMRGLSWIVVWCAACNGEGSSRQPRWPNHRKIEEQRIADLEREVKDMSARLAALEGHPLSPPPPPAPPPPPPTPRTLDREMIQTTIDPLLAAIRACGASIPTKGAVKVSVKVDPDGHVAEALIVETPDKLMGECVAGVVRGARFPKTEAGGHFSYPFVF